MLTWNTMKPTNEMRDWGRCLGYDPIQYLFDYFLPNNVMDLQKSGRKGHRSISLKKKVTGQVVLRKITEKGHRSISLTKKGRKRSQVN